MDQAIVVPVALFTMIAVVSIGTPLARAFARSLERRGSTRALPSGIEEQLAQMQQSIDSVAVEVERISEAQRFTTRLLAERGPARPADGELPAATADGKSQPEKAR